jgi:hypothetical protein
MQPLLGESPIMHVRSLSVAIPTLLAIGAGLAWLTSADAINADPGSPAIELAQAGQSPGGFTPTPGGTDQTRQRRAFSPKAACIGRVARGVGHRAALKVRLELKPDQAAKWQAYEKAADEVSAKELARCATLPTEVKERPKFTERLDRREEMAKNRLAAIVAVKPSLVALYDSLSPEQKALFDRPQFQGNRGPWRRRFDRD